MSSDSQNLIHQQLRFLRNQLMGYDSVLANSFLAGAVASIKPRNPFFDAFTPQVAVVMVGDSLTAGVNWSEVFPDIKIANRGVSGDRTIDILNRIEPILKLHPKKAFVLVGLNDFATGVSVDQAFKTYIKLIEILRQNNIEVYVQSTIECSRLRCGKQDDKVIELNTRLQSYTNEQQLVFIDLNTQLSSKRLGLLPKYTVDGSHLTVDGYVIWSQIIKPYVLSTP